MKLGRVPTAQPTNARDRRFIAHQPAHVDAPTSGLDVPRMNELGYDRTALSRPDLEVDEVGDDAHGLFPPDQHVRPEIDPGGPFEDTLFTIRTKDLGTGLLPEGPGPSLEHLIIQLHTVQRNAHRPGK